MSMKTKLKIGLILLVMIGLFGASGVSLMTLVGGLVIVVGVVSFALFKGTFTSPIRKWFFFLLVLIGLLGGVTMVGGMAIPGLFPIGVYIIRLFPVVFGVGIVFLMIYRSMRYGTPFYDILKREIPFVILLFCCLPFYMWAGLDSTPEPLQSDIALTLMEGAGYGVYAVFVGFFLSLLMEMMQLTLQSGHREERKS